jgi:hypothetical protein
VHFQFNREQAMARISKKKIGSTSVGYYHDLDPYTMHGTQREAKADRSLMKKAGIQSRHHRVSTFYTIMQDKRKNDPRSFGNVPQGPHTFPHHGLHKGLAEAIRTKQLDGFSVLIPSPAKYNKRVDKEIPFGHPKEHRAMVAKAIFKKRHDRYSALKGIQRSDEDDLRYAHVINKLIQLDPFGTYGYKGAGAGRKALKYKGEGANKPLDEQIDLPRNHGIVDERGLEKRTRTMLDFINSLGVK